MTATEARRVATSRARGPETRRAMTSGGGGRDVMPVVIRRGINHDGQSDVGCPTDAGGGSGRCGRFDLIASLAARPAQPRVRVCRCRCRGARQRRPVVPDGHSVVMCCWPAARLLTCPTPTNELLFTGPTK